MTGAQAIGLNQNRNKLFPTENLFVDIYSKLISNGQSRPIWFGRKTKFVVLSHVPYHSSQIAIKSFFHRISQDCDWR
jgi:hypothetical protein